jgi:hypothetical protein
MHNNMFVFSFILGTLFSQLVCGGNQNKCVVFTFQNNFSALCCHSKLCFPVCASFILEQYIPGEAFMTGKELLGQTW